MHRICIALVVASASASANPPATSSRGCDAFRYDYANHVKAAEGCRKNGQRDGKFRVWRPSGKLWVEGQYAGGVRDGVWVTTDREGNVSREVWEHGHVHGERALEPDPDVAFATPELIDRDGTVIRIRSHEIKGRTFGLELMWHPDGKLEADMWLWNGLKTDFCFRWDEKGRLENVYEFDRDGNLNDEVTGPSAGR